MKIPKIDASRFLLVLIILIFAAGIVTAFIVFRSNQLADAISRNQVINILFVIEDERKPVSSYVLMYSPSTRRTAVFDVPGELGLLISRINRVDRIDSIYDPARINNFQSEIEKLLGEEINFSIVISKENLVSIVDLLEGISIFIPSPVSYREDGELILFPSGITVLDGDKASVYATYSLPYEDRDMEIFRRQRFFLGFLGRLIQMNERMSNPDTAKLYYSFFKTGLNRSTLLMLFNELRHVDTDRINIQSVGGNLQEVSGQMLVIPHWNGNLIREIVRQTMGTLTREVDAYMDERALTVEVLNGTAVNGLAGRTAEMLRNFGYDVISIGNADRNTYESTFIVHRSGSENLVRGFADVIRCNDIRYELFADEEDDSDSLEFKADITLLIGRNFNGRFVVGN